MWNVRFFTVLLYVFHKAGKGVSLNPCDDGNHLVLPNGGRRGTACKRTMDFSICDRYVETGENKWYKVLGHDDKVPRKMAEGPVKMFYCGTDYPLYLPHGSHPTTEGMIVPRNVCMHVGADACKKQYPIHILKCSTFFLYNLTRPESCDIAYCFGENIPCSKPDPCDEKNRLNFPVSGDRSTSCQDSSLRLCDSVLRNSWYRPMKGNVDVKMPSSCVEKNSCGTEAPIWLNGLEPTLDDKTVDMKACVNTGKTGSCSCDREIDIQVRNCSSFLVYNLTSTPNCPERYCFGNSGRCYEESKEQDSLWEEPTKVAFIFLAVGVVIALMVALACMMHKKIFRPVCKVQANTKESKADWAEIPAKNDLKGKPCY